MAEITLKGEKIHTAGTLPEIGSAAPDFKVIKTDLSTMSLSDFKGQKVVLNIFPSLDTSVCAASIRKFNTEATKLPDTAVLCISRDLPFAHKRFCAAEGLDNVIPGSEYRDSSFSRRRGSGWSSDGHRSRRVAHMRTARHTGRSVLGRRIEGPTWPRKHQQRRR